MTMAFSGHSVRKRFGQHWLRDDAVLAKIIAAAGLQSQDCVLEVGPGRGMLTERLLASKASSVHAIEVDRDLIKGLKQRFKNYPRFTLLEGDALSAPLTLPSGAFANKVVANIPYNITGPLLERLVGRLDKPAESNFQKLVLLLQKEVADRILASPGKSNFSALSVRMQLLACSKEICLVPPKCFQPPPKVYSKVILIEPKKPEETLDRVLANKVETLLRTAFLSRRKMIKNTLVSLESFNKLEMVANQVGISLEKRPQELSPNEWVQLASGVVQLKNFDH